MEFPEFFAASPVIRMRDPLAALLGAPVDGLIEYRYADAVRLAGHSCPTVAGAFLMARAALAALYPETPAERGAVAVHMPASEDEGTTGVTAQVLTLITGAAAGGGFKGLGGRYARNGLLTYTNRDADNQPHPILFQRRDTGTAVAVELDLSAVPPHPDLRPLLMAVVQNQADERQRAAFGAAWQDRVRRLLLEHADTAVLVRKVSESASVP